MRHEMEVRLIALRSEYEKGQRQLHQLESQLTSLREALLRISGAIMVLEEIMASASSTSADQQQPGEVKATAKTVASGA